MRLSWDEMIQLHDDDDDVHDDVVLFMELGFVIPKTCYLIWISLFIYSILNKNKPKDNMTSTMSTTSKFSHRWCRRHSICHIKITWRFNVSIWNHFDVLLFPIK